MHKLARRLICTCLAFLPIFSSLAQAIIVEGSFKAKIYWQEESNIANQPLEPFWHGNLIGKIVSGNFWYEAGEPSTPQPPTHDPFWNVASYMTSAINITAQIEGNIFSVDKDVAREDNSIFIQYFDPLYEDWEIYDLYDIFQSVDTTTGQSRMSQLWLTNGLHDVLNYTQLVQNFTISGDYLGQFEASIGAYANEQELYSKHIFADIFEFSVGPRPTTVPEPSPITLLAGALALLWARLKNPRRS